jgi:site-specific DNA recombinase
VSTEEQAEHGTSLATQKEACLKVAEQKGFLPVHFCEDAGVSGARYDSRPGLMEALRMIETGQAEVLVALKFDRLARKTKILLDIADRIDAAGGQLVTCDGWELGKTPVGRLVLTLLGAIAEMERETIKERSMTGKIARARQGVQPARGLSPYGYRVVTKDDLMQGLYPAASPGDYIMLPSEAHWVRRIFEQFAAGRSLRSIAAELNTEAAPTPKQAREWYATSVRVILSNPAYKGTATFGRRQTVSGEHLTHIGDATRKLKCERRQKQRPEADWTLIDVPPIVDAELWETCAAQLAVNSSEKKAQHGGNPLRKYLLSGLTRCPSCGWKMSSYLRADGAVPKVYYRCTTNQVCATKDKRYSGRELESMALGAIRYIAAHPRAVSVALRAYDDHERERRGAADTTDRPGLQRELETIGRKIDATRRGMVKAIQVGLREEDFLTDLSALAARRSAIESLLQGSQDAPQADKPEDTATKIAAVAASIEKVFGAPEEDCTTGEKNALLHHIIEAVTPSADGAAVELRTDTVQRVFMNYQMPAHCYENASPRLKRLLGFLPSGAYG